MTNQTAPLDRDNYNRVQASLLGVQEASKNDGCDGMTFAHALAPFAIQSLLDFHPARDVAEMLIQQVELLAAMQESRSVPNKN